MKAKSEIVVRVFVPDTNGGYVDWDTLSADAQRSERERVISQVCRSRTLRTAPPSEPCNTEGSSRYSDLIAYLTADT